MTMSTDVLSTLVGSPETTFSARHIADALGHHPKAVASILSTGARRGGGEWEHVKRVGRGRYAYLPNFGQSPYLSNFGSSNGAEPEPEPEIQDEALNDADGVWTHILDLEDGTLLLTAPDGTLYVARPAKVIVT